MIKHFFSRLSIKLTILYSSLFMCIFAPTVLSYYYFTLTKIREDVRQEFASSEMVFRQLMDMRLAQISDSVRLLTQDFGFREAVATNDTRTIDSALENLGNRLRVSWAVVVDADGAVISGAPVDDGRRRALNTLLSSAENGESASDITVLDGALQQLVAMPVNAPELIGWAVFGVEMNASELQSLSDKSPVRFDAVLLHVSDAGEWVQTAITESAALRPDVLQFALQHIEAGDEKIHETKAPQGAQLILVSALPVAQAARPVVLVLRVGLRDTLVRFRDLLYTQLLIVALGVVLLTIGSWMLSLGVTRPLTQLAAAARHFGQGNYFELGLQNRSDEIGHLASSFSAMAGEIEDRTRQLKAANANLESRVAERSKELSQANEKLLIEVEQRRRSEEALLVSKTKAEAANSAKDDFLATMSHELRTPMNGIMGIVHYLKGVEMPEDSRKNLDILEESANSLLAILNDVLDFAKIESGKVEIHKETFSLRDLIAGIEDLWRSSANDKGLDFSVDMRFDQDAMFVGDKTRIRQIINNYLNNAIKFTQQGKVALSVEIAESACDTARLRLCVSDSGVGIRADEMPLLFEKFSQLEAGKARRFGGTGLGLAICRRLATAMGGEVGVTSTLGKGSDFWCTLPLQKSDAGAGALGERRDARAVGVNSGCGTRKDLRILLVEDNEINVRVMRLFIEQLGYRVSGIARDGCEAVKEIAGSRRWDVVLMDLRMPNMDGLEATRRIRKAGFSAEALPIIALTADTMESDKRSCIEAGMTDFIGKPVSPAALSSALERAAASLVHPMTSVA